MAPSHFSLTLAGTYTEHDVGVSSVELAISLAIHWHNLHILHTLRGHVQTNLGKINLVIFHTKIANTLLLMLVTSLMSNTLKN